MKHTLKAVTALALAILFAVCIAGCGNKKASAGIWDTATYRKDTALGTGSISVQVEVKADDRSVTFSIKTDKATLGEALLDEKLIAGEESEYGFYVKTVNGMLADYDIDQCYWAFYRNGEYMMTSVDATPIADGEHYEFVHTK